METTIGQRWVVYDFEQVLDGVPRNGEVVCVRHTRWPNYVISLIGHDLFTVERLYQEWLEMLDPELENRVLARIGEETEARIRGDIDTLASANRHTDERVDAEAATRKQGDIDTLASANRHTDERVDAEAAARRQGDIDTLASANRHTNERADATNERVDAETAARKQGDIDTLAEANRHTNERVDATDERVDAEAAARKQGDIDTLEAARNHTNERVDAEAAARKQGDADTLAVIMEVKDNLSVFKNNPADNINISTITDAMIGERLVKNPAEQEGEHSRNLTQIADDAAIALRDMRTMIGNFMAFSKQVKAYLTDNTVRCPQTGRLGRRVRVQGLVGGVSMTETWSNSVLNVFGANGTLGVHTNTTFWNAQIIDRGIVAGAVAIRRSHNGTGANLDLYPRYTNLALGNSRSATIVSFFMASDETDAELARLFADM